MPKPKRTHRFLATVVEHRASAGIHKLASEERLSKAVKKEINAIRPLRDPDIKVSGPGVYNVLIPDIAFQPHAGSGYPTFVAEVANSEQEVDLIAKASRYLLKTHGNVRCVLGLKIRYPPGPRLEGWIYLWEAKENPDGSYAVVTVINRRVRYRTQWECIPLIYILQQFMPYEGWDTLLLKLQYFLSPETTLPNHVQNLEIQIPLSDLADELADEQRADQPTDERNRELKRAGKTDGTRASVSESRLSGRHDSRKSPSNKKQAVRAQTNSVTQKYRDPPEAKPTKTQKVSFTSWSGCTPSLSLSALGPYGFRDQHSPSAVVSCPKASAITHTPLPLKAMGRSLFGSYGPRWTFGVYRPQLLLWRVFGRFWRK